MKKSSPISLFSFQDIITCLTGIMIVIVLIILLQLVDAMNRVKEASPLRDEVKRLEAVERKLKKERDALKAPQNDELDPRLEKFAKMSVEELQTLCNITTSSITNLQRMEEEYRKEAERLLAASVESSKKLAKLRKELKELNAEERSIMAAFAKLSDLRKKRQNMQNTVRRKRKTLRLEFAGSITGTPVIVECNYWGFRLRKHPDGKIETVGNPSNGNLKDNISALCQRLKNGDMKDSYPVFLVREEAFPFTSELREKVESASLKNGYGFELVSDREEVFSK